MHLHRCARARAKTQGPPRLERQESYDGSARAVGCAPATIRRAYSPRIAHFRGGLWRPAASLCPRSLRESSALCHPRERKRVPARCLCLRAHLEFYFHARTRARAWANLRAIATARYAVGVFELQCIQECLGGLSSFFFAFGFVVLVGMNIV